jgi:hypothetical protein
MSRKTILGIIGVIGAALTVFADQFGLAIDATSAIAGLTAVTLYILFEAKLDLKRIGEQAGKFKDPKEQAGKFKDPKFLLALASAILVALSESFGWHIPVETIVSVLTLVMSLLFGKSYQLVR